MICQFWLFAGQWKSPDQRNLLHIFGSKVAICASDEIDLYEPNYVRELWLGLWG